jgi:hypothetical protein
MVIHIYSKYIVVNYNISNYIFENPQNTPLYTKFVTFATNGTQIVLLG